MTAFLLYTATLIVLGILVRIFWVPLAIIGSILFTVIGIVVCAGVTASTYAFIHSMYTGGDWSGFSTCFMYSAVLYSAIIFVYIGIVSDIFTVGVKFISTFLRNLD